MLTSQDVINKTIKHLVSEVGPVAEGLPASIIQINLADLLSSNEPRKRHKESQEVQHKKELFTLSARALTKRKTAAK